MTRDTTQPGADNALDLDKLEALAREVSEFNGTVQPFVSIGGQAVIHTFSMPAEQVRQVANFYDAASPAAVLALIALARRAAQPVEPAAPATLMNAAAKVIRAWRDSPLNGKDHWLRDMMGELIKAHDAALATHPAEPAVPIAYLVREQLLVGEWADWETTTEEAYRFRTANPRSNIQVKAVYDQPAVPAVPAVVADTATPAPWKVWEGNCVINEVEGQVCKCETREDAELIVRLRNASAVGGALVATSRTAAIELAKQSGAKHYRTMAGVEGVQFEGESLATFIKAIATPAGALVAITDEQQIPTGEK